MEHKHIVEVTPAFDDRDPNPTKNYGIHGCEMRFLVHGDEGAVQFVIFTNWMLPDVAKMLDHRILLKAYTKQLDQLDLEVTYRPSAADLGYHSPTPKYEGQTMREGCRYLNGPCYYDGSGLQAQEVFDIMLEKGSDGVWEKLESYYSELFLRGDDDL